MQEASGSRKEREISYKGPDVICTGRGMSERLWFCVAEMEGKIKLTMNALEPRRINQSARNPKRSKRGDRGITMSMRGGDRRTFFTYVR